MAPSGVQSMKYLSSSNGPAFLARYTAKPGISSLHVNSYLVHGAAVRPNLVLRVMYEARLMVLFPAPWIPAIKIVTLICETNLKIERESLLREHCAGERRREVRQEIAKAAYLATQPHQALRGDKSWN